MPDTATTLADRLRALADARGWTVWPQLQPDILAICIDDRPHWQRAEGAEWRGFIGCDVNLVTGHVEPQIEVHGAELVAEAADLMCDLGVMAADLAREVAGGTTSPGPIVKSDERSDEPTLTLPLAALTQLLADWEQDAEDHTDPAYAGDEPPDEDCDRWWDEGYRCGILSARVDLAEAIGVSDALKACPRCSDCEGAPHHWMSHDAYGDPDNEDGGNPEHAWACKHCDHTQAECPACGGDCVGECFDGCDDIEETPA